MDVINIYRGNDFLIGVKPDDNSVQEKVCMGANEIRIRTLMNKYVEFSIGDYADVFGERYFIHYLPTTLKKGLNKWEYSLTMESYQEELNFTQYMFYGDDNTIKETEFTINGKASDFISLMITNLSRNSTGWTVGEVIDTEYENLTFSSQSCYDVLNVLAEKFGTEWWIIGKKIYLTIKRNHTGFVFQHGKNRGLYQITRSNISNANLITRLIVFGSDKNLPSDYRNYQRRLLMTGGVRYLEKNIEIYGIREGVQVFDDVYPHRDGVVTGIDITNPFLFVDTTMDFNINSYLLPGLTPKITFNSGQLTGYSFEIVSYDNSTKTFIINKNKDERSLDVPSLVIKPAIGDKYVIVDIKMPNDYYVYAEAYLNAKANKLLDHLCTPQINYQVDVDPKFMSDYDREITTGDLVFIIDTQFGINRKIPVMGCTRNIVREHKFTVTLADSVDKNPLDDVINVSRLNRLEINRLLLMQRRNSLLNGNISNPLTVIQGHGGLNLAGIPIITDPTGLPQLFLDSEGNIVRHG